MNYTMLDCFLITTKRKYLDRLTFQFKFPLKLPLLLLFFSFTACVKSPEPNVILIMADDLGYGDLACYGSQIQQTPNLDQMAKGGIKFLDYHSSGAVCSPTRAALMTGRYQQRAGIEGVVTR